MEENLKYRAYKYRIYPNAEQKKFLDISMAAYRTLFNAALAYRRDITKKYYNRELKQWTDLEKKNSISAFSMDKNFLRPQMKTHFQWASCLDTTSITYVLKDLDSAFQNFFRGSGYPRFKEIDFKNGSYTGQCTKPTSIKINKENSTITIPKLNAPMKIKYHRDLPSTPKKYCVSKDSTGAYYIAIFFQEDINTKKLKKTTSKVGIDLGIKELLVTSNNKHFENKKYFQDSEKKLAKLQRQLAKCELHSGHWGKINKKIAKLHKHIANQRNYYLHNISRQLVNENQVIVSEDLNVKGMLGNNRLAKNIGDSGWGTFMNQLQYKSEEAGRTYIKVDRFFPSSQLCSCCGYKNSKIKNLKIREWECPSCHTINGRDENAAKNILKEGLKQLHT